MIDMDPADEQVQEQLDKAGVGHHKEAKLEVRRMLDAGADPDEVADYISSLGPEEEAFGPPDGEPPAQGR